MNFEKYTVILGFIFGVISAAYFISGKGKDHDKNKLSGLGAFVAVTLFSCGGTIISVAGHIALSHPILMYIALHLAPLLLLLPPPIPMMKKRKFWIEQCVCRI